MSLEAFNIAQPLWLPIAALVAVLATAGLFMESRRRRRALDRLAQPELRARLVTTASPFRRVLKRVLIASALVLTLLALARPQLGYHWEEAKREGIELMFAVDTSKSMLAQDLPPNRLTRAKLAVADLVEKFQGDRVGLVAFAGDAFLQIPMTLDRDVFNQTLRTLQPGIVPVGGSDLASAIRVADQAFAESGNAQRLLILLSDGEDLEGSALSAAQSAAEHGVTIYTVGVGGTEGEILTLPDGRGGSQIVRDEAGQPVTSKLDEATLSAIAEATGGAYTPLGADGLGLERLYTSHLSELDRHTVESRSHRVYHERFVWLLFPALLFALIEPFLGERGRRRALGRALPTAALALALLGSTAQAAPAGAAPYNEGVSAYSDGDYSTAIERFEATVQSADLPLHERTWYNLGNSRYRAGEALQEEDVGQTRELWEAALQAYDTAIELDPTDEDAVFNRDLVARKLEQLEEPPPEDSTCDNPSDEGGGSSDSEDESDSDDSSDDGSSDSSDSDDGSDDGSSDSSDANDGSDDGSDEGSSSGADPQDGSDDGTADGTEDGDDPTPGQGGAEPEPSTEDGDQQAGATPAGAEPEPSSDEPTGLAAATPGEDGEMSAEQAAALIQALGGDASSVPLFAPAPTPRDEQPKKDW